MAGKLKLTGKLAIKAGKMLKDVCRILDENDIPYVLEGGTLLGVIRENRLLPWDNDVDLTITEDHLEKLIKIRYKFWLAGYRTRIRRSIKDMPYFPKGSVRLMKIQTRWLVFKGVSLLDIFVKKKIDDQYYWTVGINNPVLKSAPYSYYEDLDRYEFDGYHFLVPADYIGYLKHRYGNWEIPVKVYDFKKDDNAIVADKKEVKQ